MAHQQQDQNQQQHDQQDQDHVSAAHAHAPKSKRILHAQVVGATDQETLNTVSKVFKEAIDNPESVSIATGQTINVSVFDVTPETPIEAVMVRGSVTPAFIAETAYGMHAGFRIYKGDTDVPTWGNLSDSQRQGVVSAVVRALRNNDMSPAAFHQSWVNDMRSQGWSYGPTADGEAKTYPTLRPFEEIEEAKQMESVIYAYAIAVLKPRLPVPGPDLRRVEIWSIHDECFHEGEFIKLYPGALFRFIDKASPEVQQCYQTNTSPYVSYSESGAAWSIDAVAVNTPRIPTSVPNEKKTTVDNSLPPDEDRIADSVMNQDQDKDQDQEPNKD